MNAYKTMVDWLGKITLHSETCPIGTQSIADSIYTDQALNQDLHGDKSVTNHLSHVMAKFLFMYTIEKSDLGAFRIPTLFKWDFCSFGMSCGIER